MKITVSILLILIVSTFLVGSGVTSAAYNTIQNAGSSVTQRPTMNFTGGGCTPSDDSANNRTTVNCSAGGSSLAIGINGGSTSTPTTLQLQEGTGCTITSAGTSTLTVTIACGGSAGALTHHQYYTAATTDGSGGARSNLNGTSATFLGANNLGIFQMATSGKSNLTIFVPSTWDGSAINIVADATTSSNGTGNYSFTPSYACIPNGTDIGAALSYTAGSTVTQAAPGGSGTGFYREAVAMAVTPTGCAGQSVSILFTRGSGDTYSAVMYFLGVDMAITY